MLTRYACGLLLVIIGLCGFAAKATGPARAQWLDSAHMMLKLPQGLSVSSGMHFTLSSGSNPAIQFAQNGFDLPMVNSSNNYVMLSTAQIDANTIDSLLQQSLKVYTLNSSGQVLDSTAIQYSGILDQLYYYGGNDLGAQVGPNQITLKLWAPTAMQVRVYLYSSSSATTATMVYPLTRAHGVWSLALPSAYANYFYLYEVQVYQPLTDKVETSLVTDPYAYSLSMNAGKSQIVDMNGSSLKPSGWDSTGKPALDSVMSSVIYELHIRDFSVADQSLPFFYRGSYLAFTQNSAGTQHLAALARAGITHVHLLPFTQFGTVNDDRSTWQSYDDANPANLQEPQNIVDRIRNSDGYNWGYDPINYFTPSGAYSTSPDGASRVLEMRSMVMSLSQMGLRTIQDVVFNHTYQNGLSAYSIFDKIVPLYYYRTDDEGTTYTSSCCADTASEHHMMEKLMIDSVVFFAREYKIDGFRFDLMSFHSHDTMIRIRQALSALTLAQDGVDGSRILLFGEGWVFGSLYNENPSASMNILNSFGLGIGFFNDRLRDAVRGGTTDSSQKSDQGFATGLFFDFNQEPANRGTSPNLDDQKAELLQLGDVIKAGLAGNLRDYSFREYQGSVTRAGDLNFRGSPVATSAQALETINYVSAHDGYTLWDAVQAKAPFYTNGRTPRLATADDKQRMQQLAFAIPLLGEGIPSIDAGTELLRSKSGDQDSYDSGDFFNKIDWTENDNNWGKALPPAWTNYNDWSFWQPRAADPGMKVTQAQIHATENYFYALLRLRQSSSLFKLNSLNDIASKVSFFDNDNGAQPGLIAMRLQDGSQTLLIFFNASRDPRTFTHALLAGQWQLHPLLNQNVDPVLSQVVLTPASQSIVIPGRTTVVLQPSSGAMMSIESRR